MSKKPLFHNQSSLTMVITCHAWVAKLGFEEALIVCRISVSLDLSARANPNATTTDCRVCEERELGGIRSL